jgi:chromosome segregation ATPase
VEIKLSQLEESQTIEKQRLLKEKEELIQRISQAQMHLNEYQSRLERLTEANRKLFEVIDLLQRQEEKNQKGEIAQLRRERKKLVKELLQLESTLEDCRRQNAQLKLELSEFESIKREREILAIELQDLKKKQKTKGDIYKEVLNFLLENIEMEDRAISEFIHLPIEKKREFVKELLILNMKERGESLENMKGLKNVFKLKPRGGRIYFTFGENRRWKVLGLIASEDDKDKEKYAKEILIKYMQ